MGITESWGRYGDLKVTLSGEWARMNWIEEEGGRVGGEGEGDGGGDFVGYFEGEGGIKGIPGGLMTD